METKHNLNTRQFFQKIVLFIDSTLVNALNADKINQNKIITGGLLNIRDSILVEVLSDNIVTQISANNKKKQEEKNQKEISQEKKLDKDQ